MLLYQRTATELSGMLAKKECSAQELAHAVLSRIDVVEEKLGAYITLTPETALKEAAAVDAKRAAGETLSPLAGIPIAIKDNICTQGVLTTCASKILHNFVPPYDATVIRRLRERDLVFLGKTNMDEFAMGSSCENSAFKVTRNPRDPSRVPGGSSGGSAAAVVGGETILSLGSDTGGSVRQPAAYCGLVALKPTYGSVSRYGLVAFASSLDQIGPMCRSVDDTALLYGAICGHDPMDATSVPREYPNFSTIQPQAKGLRIGLPKEYYGAGVDTAVAEAVRAAAARLAEEGAELVDVSLPSTGDALAAYYILSSAEASSNLARFDGVKYGYRAKEYGSLTDMYERSRSEGFGNEVKRRIMLGTFVLSSGFYDAYYNKGKRAQKRIQAEFAHVFESCDFVLTPTVPQTAFGIGERVDDPVQMYMADILTVTVNIAGLPALVLPCGADAAGLPIGMQLIGPRFSEPTLFAAAKCYETCTGGPLALPEL